MTDQKQLKRRVRERMATTGERYTAARAHVVRGAHQPEPEPTDAPAAAAPPAQPDPAADRPSEEAIVQATGRTWDEWFAELDAWGAAERTHTETARHLRQELGVPSWWSQSVTVHYQRARGLRAPHQQADGFSIGATRTIAVPIETLWAAVCDPARRGAWLPGVALGERAQRLHRSARFDWPDGRSRLVVTFDDRGAKSMVSVQHERLPDAAEAEARKAFWRERLTALKTLLETAA